MSVPFTQTKEYLSWHDAVGEKTFYKEFGEEKKVLAIVASIIIELKIGKVLYVPYGPVIFENSEKIKKEIQNYLFDLAKKENCVFIRLEENTENKIFSGEINRTYIPFLVQPPKKTFAKEGIFQPRVEWWLDLSDTEENLLNKIHKDHRYSIRRAEKEKIEVEIVKEDLEKYFSEFWKLLKETGERDGFGLYEENYYKAIFKNSENKFLVFTKYSEKYLSVALIVMNDKVANLVFAGSVTGGREKGFNHLMQWEAIKESKKLGCEFYNFGGIYENGYGKPGLQGVTNFKKRFDGFVKFHGDFIDIPVKRVRYLLYLLYKMVN